VIIRSGTHTGTARAADGSVTGSKTETLWTASGAASTAFAVINGRGCYLIANGAWAGTWLGADVVERLEW
jgi:hypothetical protein